MAEDKFIVHTGLYGFNAYKTLDLLVRRMADESYDYRTRDIRMAYHRTGTATKVVRGFDNEVMLEASTGWRRYPEYYGNTAYDICKEDRGAIKLWFSHALNDIYRLYAFDNDAIVKMRNVKSCLNSRAWELKATCDALAGKNVEAIYGSKISTKIVGAKLDAIDTELGKCLDEEIAKIGRKYRLKKIELHNAINAKIAALRVEGRKACADLDKQQRREVSALKRDAMSAA